MLHYINPMCMTLALMYGLAIPCMDGLGMDMYGPSPALFSE